MKCLVSRVVSVAGCLLLLACLFGCGGSASLSPSPAAQPVTVTFRVYNSAVGEIPGAGFQVVAPEGASSLQIELSGLSLTAVDSLRAAAYEAHRGSNLGRFVAATTTGKLVLPKPAQNATYDLFVMSVASGIDYAVLDGVRLDTGESGRRYATLAMAQPNGEFMGLPVTEEPDAASFRSAAEQFTRAMNPFGIQYGRVDFVEHAGLADLTAAWVTRSDCQDIGTAGGQFWINHVYHDLNDMPALRCVWSVPYVPHLYGGSLMVRGLMHTYLRLPSSVSSYAVLCLLVSCPATTATVLNDPAPPVTPRGADALRYLTLMNGRLE